jgi:hypothetical protein
MGTEVDTLKLKMGNGSTPWNSLAYSSPGNQGNQGNQGAVGAGTQGNQGNQGNAGSAGSNGAGNITLTGVQGNQITCTAATVTDIFAGIAVVAATTYAYRAHIALQPALGVQGVQVGIQCSAGGAVVEGVVRGPQTVGAADKSYRQAAQGAGTLPTQMVAGAQSVTLEGIIITPAGVNTVGVQVKGVQASQAWYSKANAYLQLIKTS